MKQTKYTITPTSWTVTPTDPSMAEEGQTEICLDYDSIITLRQPNGDGISFDLDEWEYIVDKVSDIIKAHAELDKSINEDIEGPWPEDIPLPHKRKGVTYKFGGEVGNLKNFTNVIVYNEFGDKTWSDINPWSFNEVPPKNYRELLCAFVKNNK